MNLSERIADYYRRKQIERILKIDTAAYQYSSVEDENSVVSRDTVIRLFLTIFFMGLSSVIIGGITKFLRIPYPLSMVIGGIATVIGVELADHVWLRNIKKSIASSTAHFPPFS